jgi:preprotein translocase subunit SecG
MLLTISIYLLTFVELLCSFLLIGAILIQKTKQQGAGLAFGASMGETLFGSQAGNFLTRATVVLAVVFLVNTTLLSMLGARRHSGSVTDSVLDKKEAVAPAKPIRPPAAPEPLPTPDFGTPPEAPAVAPAAQTPAGQPAPEISVPVAPAAPAPPAVPAPVTAPAPAAEAPAPAQ